MATAVVQRTPATNLDQVVEPLRADTASKKHNVATVLNYYPEPADGSPPAPTYVGKPETYTRPYVEQNVVIHDVSGDESKYTLDSHGFQIYNHESREKDFVDDEKIKAEYYPETEQLLKDA